MSHHHRLHLLKLWYFNTSLHNAFMTLECLAFVPINNVIYAIKKISTEGFFCYSLQASDLFKTNPGI